MSIKAHYFLKTTAFTAASTNVNLSELKWISNDGATSILVNFEDATTGTGSTGAAISIKPNEVMDINLPVGTIYYASTESCVFRLFGIPRTG
jgi:hypothetical protein